MVRAASVDPSRRSTYSGIPYVSHPLRVRDSHPLWSPLPRAFFSCCEYDLGLLQPQHASMLVWAHPSSLAATGGVDVLFPFLRLLRCFSSPGSHSVEYALFAVRGFPHSDIHASMPISGSAWLFAGDRVLRRFWCQGIHRVLFLT